MNLQFVPTSASWPAGSRLLYIPSEHSFSADPAPRRGVTSVLVNDLHIELDETGSLLYVWGLCASATWQRTGAMPPAHTRGALALEDSERLVPGVSLGANAERWPTFVNFAQGWVCIGDNVAAPTDRAIEFAPDMVAILAGKTLRALWLHPAELPRPGR
jgi:hypothetical protein